MAGKPELANVGSDRGVQDPADAMAGTYEDPVNKMSMAERTQESTMPMAPDPMPFTNAKKAGGSR